MTKNGLNTGLLLDFFEARKPFEEVASYQGHGASTIPKVFRKWMTELSAADRSTMVEVLLGAVSAGDEIREYLPEACMLLSGCADWFPEVFTPKMIRLLEELLFRPDAVTIWLRDEDSEEDERKDFRTRWRYALILWNVLYRLKSPKAEDVFRVFTSRAKDPHFVRSLHTAKRIMDGDRLSSWTLT